MTVSGAPTGRSTPTLGGHDATDLSAGVGGVVWLAATVADPLGGIDRALALAPLALVSLGVGLAGRARFSGFAGRYYRGAVWLQPAGAVFFTASLLTPDGATAAVLAAPWLAVTGLLGLAALLRTADRGGLSRLLGMTVGFGLSGTAESLPNDRRRAAGFCGLATALVLTGVLVTGIFAPEFLFR